MTSLRVGDIVQLNKEDAAMNWIMRAKVIHVPQNQGEPFGFLDLDKGREVYTLETFTAYVLERAP